MNLKCALGFHQLVGCKCSRCGKEKHDWWIPCRCSRCGKVRDEGHVWKEYQCTQCGKVDAERNAEASGSEAPQLSQHKGKPTPGLLHVLLAPLVAYVLFQAFLLITQLFLCIGLWLEGGRGNQTADGIYGLLVLLGLPVAAAFNVHWYVGLHFYPQGCRRFQRIFMALWIAMPPLWLALLSYSQLLEWYVAGFGVKSAHTDAGAGFIVFELLFTSAMITGSGLLLFKGRRTQPTDAGSAP